MIHSSDYPDIEFLTQDGKEGCRLEVTGIQATAHEGSYTYEEMVLELWKSKGTADYGSECHLLFFFRTSIRNFRLDLFAGEMVKYAWRFRAIYVETRNDEKGVVTYHQVWPVSGSEIKSVDFDIEKNQSYIY